VIKKIVLPSVIGIMIFLLGVELAAYYISSDGPMEPFPSGTSNLDDLLKRNRALRRGISVLSPKEVYIAVDTARNLLFLKEGNRILLKAIISSGSGNILKDPSGQRQWVFDTPRGEFEVKRKIVGPTWIKPDWAFIEEGKNIPKNWKDRVEEGVLGDYALAFGDSYFIHGTLYTRLLGRNVTHGCIRVGDQDLKTIYRVARVGTRIYVF
jgi:L,D-transpeptidase ErfK/SrfK